MLLNVNLAAGCAVLIFYGTPIHTPIPGLKHLALWTHNTDAKIPDTNSCSGPKIRIFWLQHLLMIVY